MAGTVGYTLPAFPGGINVIDAIDAIPETDCVEMLNLYPDGTRLVLRGGITLFSHPTNSPVQTLANLVLADGTEKLVTCSHHIFKSETLGVSTDINGTTDPTLDEWQHVTFNNRLFLVNGTDTAQVYTGTGDVADATFTGVTLSTLVNVGSHRERLHFVKKDSCSIWSTKTVKAVSGALEETDYSYQLKKGGFIVSCGSFANQVGVTSQDLFYILSSEGEILFYQGAWPGDPAWSLIARFYIGKPCGYRAHVHVENDLWLITSQGIVPVSQLFQGGAIKAQESVSRKINPIIEEAAASFPFSYLYSAKYWPLEAKVFVSYPTTLTNTRILVCNTETYAWTVYSYAISGGALTVEISGDLPYCGSLEGGVYTMESGISDSGASILYYARGGFNFFGKRGIYKVYKDIRPLIKSSVGGLTIELDVDTNFQQRNTYKTIRIPDDTDGESTPWDSSAWDTEPWSAEDRYLFDRYGLQGQGHCAAIRVRGEVLNAILEFNAFEIRYTEGSQV